MRTLNIDAMLKSQSYYVLEKEKGVKVDSIVATLAKQFSVTKSTVYRWLVIRSVRIPKR